MHLSWLIKLFGEKILQLPTTLGEIFKDVFLQIKLCAALYKMMSWLVNWKIQQSLGWMSLKLQCVGFSGT